MWWPVPANKTPRFFQPCPGNNENNLEPGMYGITDVSAGSEAWYRPFRNSSGDTPAAPIRIATATELAAYLSSSVFDANTVLKADSNDTPVALPVGASTIVGRASTGNIAALTASQVATILNGLVTPDDHASTHETGGSDDINPAKLSGDTSAVGDKLSVGDGVITGSTDAFEVEQRDLTVIKSGTAFSQDPSDGCVAVSPSHLFFMGSSPDEISRIDRATLEVLQTVTALNNRAIACDCANKNLLFLLTNATLRIYNEDDLDIYTDITTSGTSFSAATVTGFYDADNERFYVVSVANELGYVTLAGVQTVVRDLSTDLDDAPAAVCDSWDGTDVFVVDAAAGTGTTATIRRFNKSTGALEASSTQITTASIEHTLDSIFAVDDDTVCAIINGVCYLIDSSTMAFKYTGSTSVGNFICDLIDGTVYGVVWPGSTVTPTIAQISGLTERAPKNIDLSETLSSAYKTQDGSIYTADDWSRAWEEMKSILSSGLQKRVRTVTATGDIEASDMGNIVYVPGTITADVFFTLSTEAAAMEGYSFSIAVDRNATYDVKIGTTSGGQFGWDLTGATTSQDVYPRQFLFTIINGEPVPVSTPNALNSPV